MSNESQPRRPYRWVSSSVFLFVGVFLVDLLFKETVIRSLVHALACLVVIQLVGWLVDRRRSTNR